MPVCICWTASCSTTTATPVGIVDDLELEGVELNQDLTGDADRPG